MLTFDAPLLIAQNTQDGQLDGYEVFSFTLETGTKDYLKNLRLTKTCLGHKLKFVSRLSLQIFLKGFLALRIFSELRLKSAQKDMQVFM
jgi:hypothetical protein